MDLDSIMLNENRERQMLYYFTYVWHLKTNEQVWQNSKELVTVRGAVGAKRRETGVGDQEIQISRCKIWVICIKCEDREYSQ